jgi:NAD(P)-dependent dehydrogenase (short-subunit alcohol dehydrogenase family)
MNMAQTHNGFEDKGFVVLGGTQGVGPSVILGAAKLGAKVVFGGSAESEIDVENVLADTLASNLRDRVKYVQADTTSEVDVDRFFDTALEELDEIHVLVDNLDSTPTLTSKSLAQTPLSYWNTVMTTCLRCNCRIPRPGRGWSYRLYQFGCE